MRKTYSMPPLDPAALDELTSRFNATHDAETRLRYQMILLASQGRSIRQIAADTLRSRDTVERVLRRYQSGGLDAVPRRKPPGSLPRTTPEWEERLRDAIRQDPRALGFGVSYWTTGLLAEYLGRQTGIWVGQEAVRRRLRADGYVCKRPVWTLRRRPVGTPRHFGHA